MFLSRTIGDKLNRINKKTLKIVYSDFKVRFDELLEKNGSFSINHRNIQTLSVEIFKSLNELY